MAEPKVQEAWTAFEQVAIQAGREAYCKKDGYALHFCARCSFSPYTTGNDFDACAMHKEAFVVAEHRPSAHCKRIGRVIYGYRHGDLVVVYEGGDCRCHVFCECPSGKRKAEAAPQGEAKAKSPKREEDEEAESEDDEHKVCPECESLLVWERLHRGILSIETHVYDSRDGLSHRCSRCNALKPGRDEKEDPEYHCQCEEDCPQDLAHMDEPEECPGCMSDEAVYKDEELGDICKTCFDQRNFEKSVCSGCNYAPPCSKTCPKRAAAAQ